MNTLSNVIRILFAVTAVVTVTALFPPREQMPAQEIPEICIGNRCIRLDASHRCEENPDPCSCLGCEMVRETCCFAFPPVVVK